MSRQSIKAFLASAKQYLAKASKDHSQAAFVLGNESADLDSITSALVYGYLETCRNALGGSKEIFIPVVNIPEADLALRPELTTLLKHANIEPSDLTTLDDLENHTLEARNTTWTLVDHNAMQGVLAKKFRERIVATIDHHEDEHTVPQDARPRIIGTAGSCNSLVIRHVKSDWDSMASRTRSKEEKTSGYDAEVARLSLGAILIDTANLQDKHKTTEDDTAAVDYLEAHIESSDKQFDRQRFYDEVAKAREDLDGLSLEDILRKDYKQWSENGLTLGTAAVVKPIQYLIDKDGDLDEVLAAFSEQRDLDLVAITMAYTDNDEQFRRHLYLVAVNSDEATAAAKRFVGQASKELQLQDAETGASRDQSPSELGFRHSWSQKNLAASRKQVAPLLRKAMRTS